MSHETRTIHATAVVVGETGILICGQSGAGKSTLARQIITSAQREGRFARLISDDRVLVTCSHGRLLANSVAPIEGMLEVRGMGIIKLPFFRSAVLGLIVDVDKMPQRLPDKCDKVTTFGGLPMPCISVGGFSDAAERIICFIDQRVSSKCDIYD